MSKYLIKQLKSLKHGGVSPSAKWVTSNRALLLSQITNTHTYTPVQENFWHTFSMFLHAVFTSRIFSLALRPLIILVVVALALPTAWVATGFAAQDALPGDTLYGAKRVVEKTHLVFTSFVGDEKKELELHAEFANRRANEVKYVLNDPIKKNEVTKTVDDLKNELEVVNKKIVYLKNNSSGSAMTVGVVKNVQKNTGEIKNSLEQIRQDLKTNTSTDVVLSDSLLIAKGLVKDTDINTVEAALASHLNGTGSFTREDINILVSANLFSAQEEVSSTEKGVEEIKNIVEVVKKEFASNPKKMYTNSLTSTNQLLNDQISFVAQEANLAAQTSKQVSSEVDKKVIEAQTLLIQGNFSEVVGKLKEVSNATKQVEKISDNTIQKVQNVLPVVQVIRIKESLPANMTSSTFIVTTTVNNISTVSATTTVFGTSSSTVIIIPVNISTPNKMMTSTYNNQTSTVSVTSSAKQISPSSTLFR